MRHSRSTNSGHRSSPWPAAWPRLPVAGCSWLLSSTHARDKPARGLRGDERAAVLIHLTAADLPAAETVAGDAAPHVAGEPRSAERTTGGPFGHGGSGIAEKRRSGLAGRPYARVTGGPGLPDTVVKRLTCAGRIRTAVHDQDGTVPDLGRSHRWSARGCTGHYSCAMLAAALTRAAPTPATCKHITCGIGFMAARRISRSLYLR